MSIAETSHPASLRIFFATEMWERYGFYVVQTLLALYLARHFNWNDKDIYALVGSFTALTYVSPVVGGWIADRLLGQKRTIMLGGILLCISYLVLGLIQSNNILLLSLAGIAVGTGLFKPNISSLLGNEYPEQSTRRESGFTIFYMGITTGIILGCTLPSQMMRYFSWSVSFMSGAIGMMLGLLVFVFGMGRYKIRDYTPYYYQRNHVIGAGLMVLALWMASFYILCYPMLANIVFITIVVLSVLYFIYGIKTTSVTESRNTLVIGLLCMISVVFWTFYFQMFLSFTLFISRAVDQVFFGVQFPAPYYVSIQSFGAIVIGFLLSRKSHRATLRPTGVQPGNKFQYALLFMTLAFVLLTAVSHFSLHVSFISPVFIIPVYLMISLAELLLYPVGLSAITVLAPHKKVSTMMGLFFVSLGVGGFLAGKLANFSAIPFGETSISFLKARYSIAFTQMTCLLILSLLGCMVLNRLIKRIYSVDITPFHS